MCFSLSYWCSRKGEENGNPPGPGKVLFTGCTLTQTLERGICSSTYKAGLLRAAGDEAGWWNPTLQWFCLPFRAAAHRVPKGAQQEPLLLLPFCRLCAAAPSRAAACSRSAPLPAWPGIPLPLAELTSVLQWDRTLQLGRGKSQREQEPLPVTREEIHPLPQNRVSACHVIGRIFHLSDKADSCSLLLLSWAYVVKISPRCLNLTASTGQHKST